MKASTKKRLKDLEAARPSSLRSAVVIYDPEDTTAENEEFNGVRIYLPHNGRMPLRPSKG